jgi:hypothetical protein
MSPHSSEEKDLNVTDEVGDVESGSKSHVPGERSEEDIVEFEEKKDLKYVWQYPLFRRTTLI